MTPEQAESKPQQVSDEEIDHITDHFDLTKVDHHTAFKMGFRAAQLMNAVRVWPSDESVVERVIEMTKALELKPEEKIHYELGATMMEIWLKQKMGIE